MSWRKQGALAFAHVQDQTGKLQLFLRRNLVQPTDAATGIARLRRNEPAGHRRHHRSDRQGGADRTRRDFGAGGGTAPADQGDSPAARPMVRLEGPRAGVAQALSRHDSGAGVLRAIRRGQQNGGGHPRISQRARVFGISHAGHPAAIRRRHGQAVQDARQRAGLRHVSGHFARALSEAPDRGRLRQGLYHWPLFPQRRHRPQPSPGILDGRNHDGLRELRIQHEPHRGDVPARRGERVWQDGIHRARARH